MRCHLCGANVRIAVSILTDVYTMYGYKPEIVGLFCMDCFEKHIKPTIGGKGRGTNGRPPRSDKHTQCSPLPPQAGGE